MRRIAAVLLCAFLLLPMGAGAVVGEYFFGVWLETEAFDPIVGEDGAVTLKGRICAGGPIERVEALLYDERQLTETAVYEWTPPEGESVTELSLDGLRQALQKALTPGEKHLTVTAYGSGREVEVFSGALYRQGYIAQMRNISSECAFVCSDTREGIWNDGSSKTRWTPKTAEDVLTVTLPDGAVAEGICVYWSGTPNAVLLHFYDEAGLLLQETRAGGETFTPLIAWYGVPEETRSFTLFVSGSSVEELLVYAQGETPQAAQRWGETAPKWDLMLVSTHQDDEHIFFGGAIPWYTAMGREVGVVYMTNCGANRYKEALNGLWSAGLTNYPVFLGMHDGHRDSREHALNDWGGADAVVGRLVEQIRRYRPEVVLTHDFNGEYGHKQHIATAWAVAKAVEAAADPERYPASAEQYGAWDVKKLYIHLWKENSITLDWSREVPGFDGLTGMEIARRAYDAHRSQQAYVRFSLGYKYSNERFGLYRSTVGPDVRGGDLFENLN